MASLTCTLLNGNEKKCCTCFNGVEHGQITPWKIMAFFSIQTNSLFFVGAVRSDAQRKSMSLRNTYFSCLCKITPGIFYDRTTTMGRWSVSFFVNPPKK